MLIPTTATATTTGATLLRFPFPTYCQLSRSQRWGAAACAAKKITGRQSIFLVLPKQSQVEKLIHLNRATSLETVLGFTCNRLLSSASIDCGSSLASASAPPMACLGMMGGVWAELGARMMDCLSSRMASTRSSACLSQKMSARPSQSWRRKMKSSRANSDLPSA